MLEAVHHGLVRHHSPGLDVRHDEPLQLLPCVAVVGDQAAFEAQALADDVTEFARGGGWRVQAVVLRDGAAPGDPAVFAQRSDRRLEVVAADVVEVDVDALRGGLGQQFAHRAGPVVEGGIEAELLREVLHLRRRSGAADHPARAEQPGHPADRAADRPCRRRHEDVLTGLQPRHPGQPDVRGESGTAEDAEVGAERYVRVLGQDAGIGGSDDGMRTPGVAVEVQLPDRQFRGSGVDDPPDGAPFEGRVEIPAALVHLSPCVGIPAFRPGGKRAPDQRDRELRNRCGGRSRCLLRSAAGLPRTEPGRFLELDRAAGTRAISAVHRPNWSSPRATSPLSRPTLLTTKAGLGVSTSWTS